MSELATSELSCEEAPTSSTSCAPGWTARSSRSSRNWHSNTHPEQLIEQMKEMGIYGLAIPEPWAPPPSAPPLRGRHRRSLREAG